MLMGRRRVRYDAERGLGARSCLHWPRPSQKKVWLCLTFLNLRARNEITNHYSALHGGLPGRCALTIQRGYLALYVCIRSYCVDFKSSYTADSRITKRMECHNRQATELTSH